MPDLIDVLIEAQTELDWSQIQASSSGRRHRCDPHAS